MLPSRDFSPIRHGYVDTATLVSPARGDQAQTANAVIKIKFASAMIPIAMIPIAMNPSAMNPSVMTPKTRVTAQHARPASWPAIRVPVRAAVRMAPNHLGENVTRWLQRHAFPFAVREVFAVH